MKRTTQVVKQSEWIKALEGGGEIHPDVTSELEANEPISHRKVNW